MMAFSIDSYLCNPAIRRFMPDDASITTSIVSVAVSILAILSGRQLSYVFPTIVLFITVFVVEFIGREFSRLHDPYQNVNSVLETRLSLFSENLKTDSEIALRIWVACYFSCEAFVPISKNISALLPAKDSCLWIIRENLFQPFRRYLFILWKVSWKKLTAHKKSSILVPFDEIKLEKIGFTPEKTGEVVGN